MIKKKIKDEDHRHRKYTQHSKPFHAITSCYDYITRGNGIYGRIEQDWNKTLGGAGLEKVHFIGISGIGMSGVALFAHFNGYQVSGSTDKDNQITRKMRTITTESQNEITITAGHRKENVKHPDIVVYTPAVSANNPEMIEAREKGIRCIPRLCFLKQLLNKQDRTVIGVTGTDGKTTTTAMLSHILKKAGSDPTTILGGRHEDLAYDNFHFGSGPVVAEIDESDGYLRDVKTDLAIVTNLRGDHLEHYGQDFRKYRSSMMSFVKNADRSLLPSGLERGIDNAQTFDEASYKDRFDNLDIFLNQYTRINATCAVKAAEMNGIDFSDAIKALKTFKNVDRRLTQRFNRDGLTIIDDYAHTPVEIAFTVNSLREIWPEKRLILAFEAHRYTRLKRDMNKFADVLSSPSINHLILLPVFSAYEKRMPEAYDRFDDRIKAKRDNITTCSSPDEVLTTLLETAGKETVLLFVGAGNSSKYSREVTARCEKKKLFLTN